MSGICGIFDINGYGRLAGCAQDAKKMLSAISHRGPEVAEAYLSSDSNCVMGLCAASTPNADASAFKPARPTVIGERSICVAIDGEIYNRSAVWKDLEARGHELRTASDAEAVARLYESYDHDFASKTNGAFSIAIYDPGGRRLLLARDRLGMKPLFTATTGDGFLYFASEIKAILAVKPDLKTLSENSVYEYLIYGYVSAPATMFRGVEKFRPACVTTYSTGGEKHERTYWQARYTPEYGRSAGAFAAELLSTLNQAVKERMDSDIGTGAYLSGGINSSIIVALMSKISSLRTNSFSIGFDEDGHIDVKFAAKVAEAFDCVHRAFSVKSREIELLPDIVYYLDEPLADPSTLPAFQAARVVSRHARVIFNGEGADELFGGHERYLWETFAAIYTRIPKALRKGVIEKAVKLFPASTNNFFENGVRKLRRFFEYSSYDPNYRHLSFTSYFSGETLRALVPGFEKNRNAILACEKRYENDFNDGNFENWISSVLFSDFKYCVHDSVIVKNERMNAANSIESRSPFLDYKVVELAMKMPVDYKIKNFSLKNILKIMMQDTLPLYILHRPKTGFTPPFDRWFRGDLRELLCRALTGANSFVKSAFNPTFVKNMIEMNQNGMQNYSIQLYNLFILELWHRLYMNGKICGPGVSFKDIF